MGGCKYKRDHVYNIPCLATVVLGVVAFLSSFAAVSVYQILGLNEPDPNMQHDVIVCNRGIGLGFGVITLSLVTRWNEYNTEADFGTRSRVYFNLVGTEHQSGFRKISSQHQVDPEFPSHGIRDQPRTVTHSWFQWHRLGPVHTIQLVVAHYTQKAGLFDNWQPLYLQYWDQCGNITFVCPGSHAPFQGEAELRRQRVPETLDCLCLPGTCRQVFADIHPHLL